jgi:pyruvate,water dikinase
VPAETQETAATSKTTASIRRARPFVLALSDCLHTPTRQVGGKALGLGRLIGEGLPVPGGFVVTADAFRHCVRTAGLTDRIARIVSSATDRPSAESAAREVADLFGTSLLTEEVTAEIGSQYRALGCGPGAAGERVPVAVRSSATAEDLADASFAGQQDTYLWVIGEREVAAHLVRCWASLFTPRAIQYRRRLDMDQSDLAMAVVVQRMVDAEAAGVLMTLEPVTGDRDTIYLEATYGLGEGVVRGDVGVDRWWVHKPTLTAIRTEIESKTHAHRVDTASGEVRLTEIPLTKQRQPCLDDAAVLEVAGLGRLVEQAFGIPMDIEWAIDNAGEVQLLQARPETVWSRRTEDSHDAPNATPASTPPAPSHSALPPAVVEAWNPLHEGAPQGSHWTTTNVGEAMPGVLTPLSWSVWRPVGHALPELAYAVGAISDDERRRLQQPKNQPMRAFYGRAAFQLDFFAMLGDRLPGTSGPEAARSLLGRIPNTLTFQPTRRRYPFVALRFPRAFLAAPRQVAAATADTDTWYRASVAGAAGLGLDEARRTLLEAQRRLVDLVTLQTIAVVAGLQPVHDALEKLVTKTGIGDVATLSGGSGAEMLGLVGDLWRVSRAELDLDTVVERHGFHGPLEGELSSHVWREDPSPLQRLVLEYGRRPAEDDPHRREAQRDRRAAELRPQLLAALPATRRPLARAILTLAAKRLPLRGVVKASLLQAFDLARACARAIGHHLAAAGTLADPDDVFYLTVEELTADLPPDLTDLVHRRRNRRAAYQQLDVPSDWRGAPAPAPLTTHNDTTSAELTGIGVSPGVVEGIARVVTDPGEDIEPDEILVASTTDPSWSSIMFVSKALVVDIGGALSHAAVVARELGVPCVVNTRIGTRALRTGDLVRVDGKTGTVEVLQRAAQPSPESKEVAGAGQ